MCSSDLRGSGRGVAIQFYGPKGAVWVLFGAVAAAALVVIELDHGIARKILDAGRWSFVSAVMSALTLLSDDEVILAPVRFIRWLAESLKREIGQWVRIIFARPGQSPWV